MQHVHLTPVSKNVKTGPIPVSTSSALSCPESCPFNTSNVGGCYATSGPLAIHWKAVTQGKRGDNWEIFLGKIAALPKGQLWRHNQAGDLQGEGDTLDIQALSELIQANRGKRGFTYTHKPLNNGHERDMVAIANNNGFTINLSGNNLSHADSLYDMGIGPVTVVLPASQVENTVTPKGRKVVVCPATIRDNVSCASCGLCAIVKRDCIVGFPSHGTAKRKASAIASQP